MNLAGGWADPSKGTNKEFSMTSINLSRRGFTFGLAVAIAAPSLAQAADPVTAKSFVEVIYNKYVGKNTSGVVLDKAADYRRYFTPALASIILKDQAAAAKRGDVPTLDGDAFVGHQDWEISKLTVDVQESGDKAAGTVSFVNIDQPETVGLKLQKIGKDWRIDDVTYADKSTLRGLFKK
jgi:uncharacterized protein DUF3828